MLDALLRRWTRPLFDAAARRHAGRGAAFTLAALVLGLAALAFFASALYPAGLVLLLVSRPLAALAAASARLEDRTDLLAAAFALDAVVLAGVPFAFALADPSHALAATFLIFALSANTASSFAFADAEGVARGLIGPFEILIGFTLVALCPAWFGPIAYVLGVLCFVSAGARLAPHVAQRRSL